MKKNNKKGKISLPFLSYQRAVPIITNRINNTRINAYPYPPKLPVLQVLVGAQQLYP
jgi:hypothetical protein